MQDSKKLKGFNVNILNHSKIQIRHDHNVTIPPNALDRSQAIELMRTSNSIQEWNSNREFIKNNVGIEAFMYRGYSQDIDTSGLVTRIGLKNTSRLTSTNSKVS
jgi:hypothetical protein